MMHALDDAIHNNLGKATDGVILSKDEIEDRISKILHSHMGAVIDFDGNYKLLQDILKKVDDNYQIIIRAENIDEVKKQNPKYSVIGTNDISASNSDLVTLKMCEHVSKVTDRSLKVIYVDPYSNVLETEKDIKHFESYEYNRDMFIKMWGELI